MQTSTDNTLRRIFFEPVDLALGRAKHLRATDTYSDHRYLYAGIGRVIKASRSGREWIQCFNALIDKAISVSNFFDALRSSRRLKLLSEIDHDIRQQTDSALAQRKDPFAAHPELAGFSIRASDGHSHGASVHETPIVGKKRAVTHIYSMNLRTGSIAHLALTCPAQGRKKEHELATLKRLGGRALRFGAPVKTKVIHLYDPASIDYRQWWKWKQSYGVYIISREKSNSRLMTIGLLDWDRSDPRNRGVLSDERVGTSNGVAIRRIRYRDVSSGEDYTFLTNEMTLPPGLIAFLYKKRWDVEKVFDEFKNKLEQKKAWGKHKIAKTQQALFVALAHNLMLLLEHRLEVEEGIRDEKVRRKQTQRLAETAHRIRAAGKEPHGLEDVVVRATQRSLQFIRWLQIELILNTSWRAAVERLRPLMLHYLS